MIRGVNAIYVDLIHGLLVHGEEVQTRNSVCKRTFGERVKFDRCPLVSVRKAAWKNALREMEWVLSGSTNLDSMHPDVHPWWKPWANEYGNIPYGYGDVLRWWGEDNFDQIGYLLNGIRGHPFSRRNVVTTWDTEKMASPECPITNCWGTVIQAFVDTVDRLHLVTYQRSADVICGLPHNWVQMWAFQTWLARRAEKQMGTLTWMGGDVHLYQAHYDLARMIVDRGSLTSPPIPEPPALVYLPSGEDFRADDFSLSGPYEPLIQDRAEMVV